LAKAALSKWIVGPCGSELPHVLQARSREPPDPRERCAQVGGEAIDDLRAPAFLILSAEDLVADLPVAAEEFFVGGGDGTLSCNSNPVLDGGQEKGRTQYGVSAAVLFPTYYIFHIPSSKPRALGVSPADVSPGGSDT